MIKRLISIIPSVITCLNLLSGCVAVIMAFHHNEMFGSLTGCQWAYIFIAAAALFDFCDGASARLLHAYSLIGKELDSLSDLVSFGVAPGMLMYNIMAAAGSPVWACATALLIPALGAVRLARFNIDSSQATSFKGLPIPANALFWIGFSSWMNHHGYAGTAVTVAIITVISLTMVANFRMFSLKFHNLAMRENFTRYVIILAAALFLAFYGVAGLAWTVLLYLLISIAAPLFMPRH